MAFPLTKEQQDIVQDRGGELLVSAAAGSGKTRVLVERLLDRITKENIDIDRFLVITFTKAAAAELRSRIAQELSQRLALDPGDRHLRRQSTLIYRTQISTIHSFCTMFLRENGHLLDLETDFRLCDEGEAQILMAQALDQILDRRYEQMKPGDPFVQLVDSMGAGRDDSRLGQIVLDIYRRIQSHPVPEDWLTAQKRLWELDPHSDAAKTCWGDLLLRDAKNTAEQYLTQVERLLALSREDALLFANYGESLAGTIDSLTAFLRAESWDQAAACMPIAFPAVGRRRKRTTPLTPEEEERAGKKAEYVKESRDRIKKRLEQLSQRFEENSQPLLLAMTQAAPAVQALMDLIIEFQQVYGREKKRRNLVDYSDLEHNTVQLLSDGAGQPTQLAQHWSQRYTEVMVDEYQDTNQVQNAIIMAITKGGETLFEVGDVKQSIYRFRLADPTIFLKKFERFPWGGEGKSGKPRKRVLTRNFRSRPQVLLGCNDLFRAVMSKEFGELDYTQEQALVPGAQFPEGDGYAVELNLLDLSFMKEQEGEKENKDRIEARFAAKRIRQLLDGPMMITEGATLRPLRPSDIMILLRSPGVLMRHYIHALSELGIPWSAERPEELFETTEINVAMSILQIVDNPRQDVALLAALRSPVFCFSADRLAMIRADSTGDFYDALCHAAKQGNEDCRLFLDELAALRFGAGDKSCRQLIWHIYEKSNLLGIFGAMDHGRERQENLLALYELAGQMEQAGCRTLFQFLLRLEKLRSSGAKLPAVSRTLDSDGVSILSIHRSKGLEKPVVLLCGLNRRLNTEDFKQPVLFHPRLGVGPMGLDECRMIEYPTLARTAVKRTLEREMMAEELRLLYVAMTRAKEKLIFSMGITEGIRWLERFRDQLEAQISPATLESQGSVGQWIMLHALTRPEAAELRKRAELPNVTASGLGPAWDIRWEEGCSLSCLDVAAEDDIGVAGEDERIKSEEYPDLSWRYPYRAQIDIPSKITATQLKKISQEMTSGEEMVQNSGDDLRMQPLRRPDFIARTHGLTAAQRGTAFHLAMEHIDPDGDCSEEGISLQLDQLADAGFFTELQREAVSEHQLSAFWTSDVGRAMAKAREYRREYKFSLLVPAQEYVPGGEGEKILLQGVVDAWYDDGDGVTIIDFKSDRIRNGEESQRAKEYAAQLEAYRNALSIILERPIKACVLWFLHTGTAVYL